MKKIFTLIAAIMIAFAANAQDSKMAAGVNFNVGFGDSWTNCGLGAKYQYSFTEHWRGEASFNYFFKKDYVSKWDANLTAHYLFNLGSNGFKLYPLAGIGLVGWKADTGWGDSSSTDFGFHYGLGAEYPLSDSWKINAELKGQTADGDTRGIFSIGCAFCF